MSIKTSRRQFAGIRKEYLAQREEDRLEQIIECKKELHCRIDCEVDKFVRAAAYTDRVCYIVIPENLLWVQVNEYMEDIENGFQDLPMRKASNGDLHILSDTDSYKDELFKQYLKEFNTPPVKCIQLDVQKWLEPFLSGEMAIIPDG